MNNYQLTDLKIFDSLQNKTPTYIAYLAFKKVQHSLDKLKQVDSCNPQILNSFNNIEKLVPHISGRRSMTKKYFGLKTARITILKKQVGKDISSIKY